MKYAILLYWKSVKTCLRKYAVFTGRSSRQEYLSFVLFIILVSILLGIIELSLGLFPTTEYSVLSFIFELTVMIPSFAVEIRRLHDVNRSGWWIFINLTIIGVIPFVYWIVIKKSDEGENKFGRKPLI